MVKGVPEGLRAFFAAHPKLALAFSGGTDSAYLLYAATACGCDVTAYCVKSAFQPSFETEDARRLAEALGARLKQAAHLLRAAGGVAGGRLRRADGRHQRLRRRRRPPRHAGA